MSEYTAEDFAKAMFARHGDGGRAARFAGDKWPWRASTADAVPWLSDEEMARDGWVPVVEAEDPEAVVALIGRQAEELADLREENYRLERILQSPLSLKDLEVAWEAAEVADECREGDVLIIRDDEDNYLVRRMGDRSYLGSTARILSRAPREPWQDLADDLVAELAEVLAENVRQVDVEWAAQKAWSLGWRKGGDDDE